MATDKKLVFIHIPKAAGSTLLAIIRANYSRDKSVYLSPQLTLQNFLQWETSKKKQIQVLAGHQP